MNGFDYRAYVRQLNKLKQTQKAVQREINYAAIALAEKFAEVLAYNSPYDTGQLEDSWIWDIGYHGEMILIKVWNVAENDSGQYYAEWVNDGHRLLSWVKDDSDSPAILKEVGFVEGQFFIEFSEYEIQQLIPDWQKTTERQIAKVLVHALKG